MAINGKCEHCGGPWFHASNRNCPPVPAPPTRTEEPEKLTPEEFNRLDSLRTSLMDKVQQRLAFLEAERENLTCLSEDEAAQISELARLREQIETMREFFRMNRHEGFNYARHRFNDLFPPERP